MADGERDPRAARVRVLSGAGRAAAAASLAVLWLPVARVGLRPYRPWLLARRIGALGNLIAVDAWFAVLLYVLLAAVAAVALTALLPVRWWRVPAIASGLLLAVAGAVTAGAAAGAAALSPGAGSFAAAIAGTVLGAAAAAAR